MTDFIYIEPAHSHRPGFALWALAQKPQLQTSSATGWNVPVDLYPSVPAELLDGAYVDGYLYSVAKPQPAAVEKAPEAPVVVEQQPEAPVVVEQQPEAPVVVEQQPEVPAAVKTEAPPVPRARRRQRQER